MIGPNTPGVILPNIMKIGIMPGQPFTKGNTVVLSRSGTLMYEVSYNLSKVVMDNDYVSASGVIL